MKASPAPTPAGQTAGTLDSLAGLESVIGHYRFGNWPIFQSAYREILRESLDGQRILEVCAGFGDLAAWIAGKHPGVRVVAIDQFEGTTEIARRKHGHLPNLEFLTADVLNLSRYPDGSFDLVIGQATMHHLANNLPQASREFARVLKPGGRCLFIYEPLGHNAFIAVFRALLNTRHQFVDESFLFDHAIQDFAANFRRHEVQRFNLLSFWIKGLPPGRLSGQIVKVFYRMDEWLFQRAPWLRKHAGCFNAIYWK